MSNLCCPVLFVMIRSFSICLTFAALLGFSSAAISAIGPAREALNQFSGKVKTLSGNFSQTIVDANGRTIDESSGLLKLQAPRQFRWDVQKPEPQLVIADGDNIWVYDIELEQVSVRPQSFDESNSPLAVLLDLAMLDQEFFVSESGNESGLQWLQLKSRAKEPEFQSAKLGFDKSGLAQMQLTDNFGQRTIIRFSQWRKNTALLASEFKFTPPAGVDVVGQTAGKATVTGIPE